ncbi:MAG: AAA family ATPase, partial [Candidatus Aenigmarchaeota archaeon]|nr:AAA family ATPase [Candidatus Aenigmarchaeota archaeon]
RRNGSDVVKLTYLTHHNGVNALAADQTIEFGPSLTIVYGDNASGKSGYSRILKRACRARGSENILGNVLGGLPPGHPSATIGFSVGEKNHNLKWNDQEVHNDLSYVSVFDLYCAAIYLKEKTDVAFRPFGLDVFDKLSAVCEEVRKVLEKERRELEMKKVVLPSLPEGTAAQKAISNITSLTNPEDILKLCKPEDIENHRLKQLDKELQDLQAKDPIKKARFLNFQADRLESLGAYLVQIDDIFQNENMRSLFDARDLVEKKNRETAELQTTTFPHGLLNGTGSDLWHKMWEAARNFSDKEAYERLSFPSTETDARCVLCQQSVGKETSERFMQFERFVKSTVQKELDEAKVVYYERRRILEDMFEHDDMIDKAIDELELESEELAKSVKGFLENIKTHRNQILKILQEGEPVPDIPVVESYVTLVQNEARALKDRADKLLQDRDVETENKLLRDEQQELYVRKELSENIKEVIDEIERKKKLAAYTLCLQDANTTGITRKSTEVTRGVVTRQLAKSFQDELKKLNFTHLEVELKDAGGTRGALYHNLVLKRAPGVHLDNIVSEGEARCLSIATFFAELSTATDKSAIIFDDPVSSLDHKWREHVARRLVEEARTRQIIVFTHDIVFLLALKKLAEDIGVSYNHQYLQRHNSEAGICSQDLPWVAKNIKERIGYLKEMYTQAEKLNRTSNQREYENEAKNIYGHLREAWERSVEEVLLYGVVERYRHTVETKRTKYLSDISVDELKVLDAAMTKCSRWMIGHNQAPAENVPIPSPDELKADIEELDTWTNDIRKRRK